MASTRFADLSIALSRVHWPVTTLGFGNRIGIWFQGCSIHCKGCCAQDTWEILPHHQTTIGNILAHISSLPLEKVHGITITGGEPFDQPEALNALIQSFRTHLPHRDQQDILVYSGYPWSQIVQQHDSVLAQVDTIISEPFVVSKATALLRGSGNQTIHCLSPLGEERYRQITQVTSTKTIQIHQDGDRVWIIGIPQRGDLERLESRLKHAGIVVESVTWRS